MSDIRIGEDPAPLWWVLLVGAVAFVIVSCTEPGKPAHLKTNLEKKRFSKICLEGHVYFIRDNAFADRGLLAIKLNSNGYPIKCKEKQ